MAGINQRVARCCLILALPLLPLAGRSSALLAQGQAAPAASVTAVSAGAETLDRVVAIVNGEMILDSDVDTEARFQRLAVGCGDAPDSLPCAAQESRAQLVERLVNQRLILGQMQADGSSLVSEDDVDAEIAALPSQIPACRQERCGTAEGWSRFLTQRGFTVSSFREYWLQRQAVLEFIEQRFRPRISIDAKDIDKYYSDVLLPRYRAAGRSAPPLSAITAQISNILVEQNISRLLDDWLATIRAQSHIQTFPAEAPSA